MVAIRSPLLSGYAQYDPKGSISCAPLVEHGFISLVPTNIELCGGECVLDSAGIRAATA